MWISKSPRRSTTFALNTNFTCLPWTSNRSGEHELVSDFWWDSCCSLVQHVFTLQFIYIIYLLFCGLTRFQYHIMFTPFNRNTTTTNCRAELLTITNHTSPPLLFCGVHVSQSFVFCVEFCISLYVLCPFSFHYIVLRFTASDYNFSIFKLFLLEVTIN